MRISSFLYGATAISLVAACPGTEGAMGDLKSKLPRRNANDPLGPLDSSELIGDLLTVGAKTEVGKAVKNILLGKDDPESDDDYDNTPLYPKGSPQCKADTCCIWRYVAQDLEKKFKGESGRCTAFARGAVRLGFHDAGVWSKTSKYGGADGSIVLSDEGKRPVNNGLSETIAFFRDFHKTYQPYGVGMADLIQMGATVATVVCPLGPRIRSFVGRKDNNQAGPDGLLPDVNDPADKLIALFQAKTINPHGLAALLGAHTTSQQRFVDPSRANDPQDSTPGVWDVKFYGETIGQAPPRVFKFKSDIVLSAHPKLSEEWREFAGPGGQEHWNEDYAREYVRLSLLGVNNINNLKECTKVLPAKIESYRAPDQAAMDKWLAGGLNSAGEAMHNAMTLSARYLSEIGENMRSIKFRA